MILVDLKAIFIHIPKTAGQSIELFFLKLHGLEWSDRKPFLIRYNNEPALGPKRLAHLTAAEYIKYGYISKEEFERCFKFSFVRNPWSRLVSEYRYRGYDKRWSFKDFVTRKMPRRNSYSDRYRHILPQYDFLHDDSGKLLVDFVGKFERLQEDFDHVCGKLGVAPMLLPHANASDLAKNGGIMAPNVVGGEGSQSKTDYRDYYDEELASIVGRLYEKDIKTFCFRFDP